MKVTSPLVAFLFALALAFPAAAQDISGSGSTFVYPVMAKWAKAYGDSKGITVTYEPIGSGGGVREITSGAVDFGVTDAPLNHDELARRGLVQFPVVIGGILPVVNLPGIAPSQLHFTGKLLADIFQGKVTRWNDPAIVALNPGTSLPAMNVTVIHRSDNSGTTFNWVNYLAGSSADWKAQVGEGTSVDWPTGYGGNGNSGVADCVAKAKGAIGYVEYAYVLQRKMTYGLVQNRAGIFVSPGYDSFAAAATNDDWQSAPDFALLLNDSSAADAYPIVGTSFVLMNKQPRDAARGRVTLDFFRWAMTDGEAAARSLGYVPLPLSVARQVSAYWTANIR
jgi:phosphate transport system substrate-binding protein